MATITHDAIIGGRVTFDARVASLSGPATSAAVFKRRDGSLHELVGGSLQFGEERALQILGQPLDEEYEYAGGRLLVGFSEQMDGVGFYRTRLGVWEGARSSVSAHLSGPSTTADLMMLFDAFHIVEQDDGPALTPRDHETVLAEAPSVLKQMPEVGLVTVEPMTHEVARALPRWRGRSVRGGELFRDESRIEMGALVFHLVHDTSRSVVAAGIDTPLETMLEALDDLEVVWEAT